MTGYGEASREADGMVFTVEIRSVNNRYYKSHLRLPDLAAFLEGELEKILRDQVARGTVGYSLHMKNLSGPALFDIDGARVKFPHGWALVRASNTQPSLVVRYEADSAEELQKIQSQVDEVIRGVQAGFKA
jgi:phosphomannomutase/phosphoglucomutase